MNAWDEQLGVDLLAAVEQAADGRRVRAVTITGAGRGFSSGADLKAGFEPTPEGHPGRRAAPARALPPDHHRHPARCPSRCWPRSTGPAVGDRLLAGARLRPRRWPRESAYFLLAFVNIGLVPDGGSSLLVPARVGLRARGRDGDAGRARPGAAGAGVGPDQPRRRRRRVRRARSTRWPSASPPARPRSYAGSKRQLNAWIYSRGWTSSSSSRPRSSRRWPRSGDFLEGVQAFLEQAPAALQGVAESDARGAPTDRLPARGPCRHTTLRRACARWLRSLLAPDRSPACSSPRPAARRTPTDIHTLYILDLRASALVVFIGVEGMLICSLFKFRARRGRVAAQIHGNTRLEIGWTVGAAVILVFITVVTFIKLPAIKNPPAVGHRRQRQPGRRATRCFASTDQQPPPKGADAEHHRRRPAVRVALPVPAAERQDVFAYDGHGACPVGMTVIARHHVRRRRPLVVDPGARRQDGRDPRLHRTDLVQDRRSRPARLHGPVRRAVRAQPREHVRRASSRVPFDAVPGLVRPPGGGQQAARTRRQAARSAQKQQQSRSSSP